MTETLRINYIEPAPLSHVPDFGEMVSGVAESWELLWETVLSAPPPLEPKSILLARSLRGATHSASLTERDFVVIYHGTAAWRDIAADAARAGARVAIFGSFGDPCEATAARRLRYLYVTGSEAMFQIAIAAAATSSSTILKSFLERTVDLVSRGAVPTKQWPNLTIWHLLQLALFLSGDALSVFRARLPEQWAADVVDCPRVDWAYVRSDLAEYLRSYHSLRCRARSTERFFADLVAAGLEVGLDDMLSHVAGGRREFAIRAAASLPRHVPCARLEPLSRDSGEFVRSELIRTIYKRRCREMYPVVIRALHDKSSNVRDAAAKACRRARITEAGKEIVAALEDYPTVPLLAAAEALHLTAARSTVLQIAQSGKYEELRKRASLVAQALASP
jgi:hypothetical protein